MNIQFITNRPCSKSTLSNNSNQTKATSLSIEAKSCQDHIPSDPSSASEISSSPSLLSAPSDFPKTPVDCSLGPVRPSAADNSSSNSSFDAPPKKVSKAWRKTFDDYFKSDDENILSSDDEWWLGSRKRITDQEEIPSGKTRLSKPIWGEKLCSMSDGTHDLDDDCRSSSEEPESPPDCNYTQVAQPSNFTFAQNSQSIPTLSNSNFPPLGGTVPKPKSDQTSWRNSSWNKVSSGPSVPWSMVSSGKKLSSTPDFSSLPSSSNQALSTRPGPRLICSFSSTCQKPLETKNSDVLLAMQRERNLKKTLAISREESLRSSFPAFKLQDPSYSPVTVSLCPSAQHPLSELPDLINSVVSDGIALPTGKAELEGGPYVAVAFDMEWEISYTRGQENKTALIQLANPSRALIIQLSNVGPWSRDGIMPQCLLDFLIDPQIVKLGVGIRNDGLKLLRDHKYGPKPYLNNLLEISRLTKSLGPLECATGYHRLMSLQQIVADHLKVYLPKDTARISDWTKALSSIQLDYAASDVIATVRVTQKLFHLFKQKLKSKTNQSIFDLIESLEPVLQRDQTFRPPVVPSPREWATIQPPSSKDLDQKSKHDNRHRQSINALKTRVPPRVKEAWEFWYHQGLSVEQCAETMKIKPTSVAIYLGKMLIHLNLNSMTLNDYFLDKLKTTIDPKDDHNSNQARNPGQADDTCEINKIEDEIVAKLPEDNHVLANDLEAETLLTVEEKSDQEVDIAVVRVSDSVDLDVVKNHVEEESLELNIDHSISSNLDHPLLPNKNKNNDTDIGPTIQPIECRLVLDNQIDSVHGITFDKRETNLDDVAVATEPIELVSADVPILSNLMIQPIENSLTLDNVTDSLDQMTFDKHGDKNLHVAAGATDPTVSSNPPIEPLESTSILGVENENNSPKKGVRVLDLGQVNPEVGSAPTDLTGFMDSPIILEDKPDGTAGIEIDASESILPIQPSENNSILDNGTVFTSGRKLDIGELNLDIGTSSHDHIGCTNSPHATDPNVELSTNPTVSSFKSTNEPLERNLDIENKNHLMAASELDTTNKPDRDSVTASTDEIVFIETSHTGSTESSLVPESEADLPQISVLHAEDRETIAEIGRMKSAIEPAKTSLDLEVKTEITQRTARNPDEPNMDVLETPADQIDCKDAKPSETSTILAEKKIQVEEEAKQLIEPSEKTKPNIKSKQATLITPSSIRNVPMEITLELGKKMESIRAFDPKNGSIHHLYLTQLNDINQSKLTLLKSIVLKFRVNDTLKVDLKTFGFL